MCIRVTNTLVCTCNCGASTFTPSASCTTSARCSEICYWGYSSCYKVNTQGCCGSLGCVWYSGEAVYNEPGTCVCKCGSWSSGGSSSSEQGRSNSSTCAKSTCQRACQILYPSTCGTYTNDAYCLNMGAYHQTNSYFIVFLFITVIYLTHQ